MNILLPLTSPSFDPATSPSAEAWRSHQPPRFLIVSPKESSRSCLSIQAQDLLAKGMLTQEQLSSLTSAATALRGLLRVKIADDADLDQVCHAASRDASLRNLDLTDWAVNRLKLQWRIQTFMRDLDSATHRARQSRFEMLQRCM